MCPRRGQGLLACVGDRALTQKAVSTVEAISADLQVAVVRSNLNCRIVIMSAVSASSLGRLRGKMTILADSSARLTSPVHILLLQ